MNSVEVYEEYRNTKSVQKRGIIAKLMNKL